MACRISAFFSKGVAMQFRRSAAKMRPTAKRAKTGVVGPGGLGRAVSAYTGLVRNCTAVSADLGVMA